MNANTRRHAMPPNTTKESARLRLTRVSRSLEIASRVGMWLWPLFSVGVWLVLDRFPASSLQALAGGLNPGIGSSPSNDPVVAFHITWKVKIAGMAVSVVPAALQFLFMRQWVVLFGLYRRGRIFETENVRCFARMGKSLLALSAFEILLSTPIHGLVLTLDNPSGKHMLGLGLSSDHLSSLATAIALVVIAWVMDEGCKLRSEADLVV